MHLRKPDRVPVAPLCMLLYATRIRGISNKDAMYHKERWLQANKEETINNNWDLAPSVDPVQPARPMEILGLRQFKWSGGGLDDNDPFQWVEGEYMTHDEYDEMLADPNAFTVKKLLPRVSSSLAPLAGMAQMPAPPLIALSNAYTLSPFLGGMLLQSNLREVVRKLIELLYANNSHTSINLVGGPIPQTGARGPWAICIVLKL